MRWGRKETQVKKDTLREECYLLNTLLKNDALGEERDPRRKEHSEGGKLSFNRLLKNDALGEARNPGRKGSSEG